MTARYRFDWLFLGVSVTELTDYIIDYIIVQQTMTFDVPFMLNINLYYLKPDRASYQFNFVMHLTNWCTSVTELTARYRFDWLFWVSALPNWLRVTDLTDCVIGYIIVQQTTDFGVPVHVYINP